MISGRLKRMIGRVAPYADLLGLLWILANLALHIVTMAVELKKLRVQEDDDR
jgi:hypothetical protein